jgi:hypothetical protein
MTSRPLLTIIVPTNNRQSQCEEVVRSICDFEGDFELIVFDTSDDELLRLLLSDITDSRVNYVRGRPRQNMTENFEQGIRLATGQYVCMIGDDDGVTPFLFKWVRVAAQKGYSSVTTEDGVWVLYNWPGIRSRYFGSIAGGLLRINAPRVSKGLLRVGPAHAESLLRRAGQGCSSLPRAYHGLVRRDVVELMYKHFGRCFAGVSPDVSFSYLAALVSDHHAVVDEPLTISGASPSSNAGRAAMHRHKGDLWSDPHMRFYQTEHWPRLVPEFFSAETVWAQATLAAMDLAHTFPVGSFNFPLLYSLLLVRHPGHLRDIWRALSCWLRSRLSRSQVGAICHVCVATILTAIREMASAAGKVARLIFRDRESCVIRVASQRAASQLVGSRWIQIV